MNHTMRTQRAQAGFSVVELAVVVVIALVVLAIAIPNVLSSLEGYRLDSAVRSIAGRLSDARLEAIKRNTPTRLIFNAAAGTYQVQTAAGVNLGPAETLPNGITFDAPPTPAQIDYDPIGRLSPPPVPPLPGINVRLRVTRSGQIKNVFVAGGGGVSFQ